MRKIIFYGSVFTLIVSGCSQTSPPQKAGGPEIKLEVAGPGGAMLAGSTSTMADGKTYYCKFSGGNVPGGNGGDVQFTHGPPVTFPVNLHADAKFSITDVKFPVDPKHQLSKNTPVTKKQAVIKDMNTDVQQGTYEVYVADSSTTTFVCHPMIINH